MRWSHILFDWPVHFEWWNYLEDHQRYSTVIYLAVHLENGRRVHITENTAHHLTQRPPEITQRHVMLLNMFIVSIPITGSVFTYIYFPLLEDQHHLKIFGAFKVEYLLHTSKHVDYMAFYMTMNTGKKSSSSLLSGPLEKTVVGNYAHIM